jgi:hypothetical protein
MKNISWKKIVPHAIAIGIFLLVAVIYCRPALEGQVLQQSDVVHWKGMAQDAFSYKEKHGHYPLWNTHLFSGMPNYQVTMEGHNLIPDFGAILTLWLPRPASFFFLACLCFYLLSMTYGVNIFVAVLGALGFAYATYDPLIITVGHETKMMAMAYMPGLLAGLLLLYNKKYGWGMIVTALFAIMEMGAGHPQVTFYLLIVAGIMTVFYIVKWIRAGEIRHMVIALCLALLGGLIGVGNSALTLLTTYEYTKYTIRGGKTTEVTGENGEVKQVKTTGLDQDYAFSYSLRNDETLVLMMPDAFGGMPRQADESSKVVSALVAKGIPETSASQLAASLPRYWGGILPYTAGPPYTGALICFLAVIGFAVLRGADRWWIATATVLMIFIAWGSYFSSFNVLLFKYVPMFNKFRAPSMALILPQMLLPLLAVLGLQEMFFSEDAQAKLKKNFKIVLYSGGGLFVLALLVYLFSSYGGGFDDQIYQGYSNPQQGGSAELGRMIIDAMKAERKAMFGAGLMHAFWLGAVALLAVFAYVRNWVKPVIIVVVLIIVNTADLLMVDTKFLNSESFQDAQTAQSDVFAPTPADQQIMQDTDPHYRVLNLASGDPFTDAITSYHHRSMGGYHAAKLSIYQDVLSDAFSSGKGGINMGVLNMLDVRYLEVPTQQQPGAGVSVQRNPDALGAAWFVKNIQFVNGASTALKALNGFNPKDTAIVESAEQTLAGGQPQYDSTASIKLDSYDNDAIKYTTNTHAPQFAVMSEVYYPAGWNAYLDGKKTQYVNADYILRGIAVPAGQHTLEFKFEPASYRNGQIIVYITNVLFWLSVIASIFAIMWKKQLQKLR